MRWVSAGLAALSLLGSTVARSQGLAPFQVEAKLPLGDVKGRIDHLAYDAGRQRLYVAELGNNTVGVIDLKQGRVLRRLPGFGEPQGIGYEPSTDTVWIANGDDGAVHILRAEDFAPVGKIDLGDDADNIRIEAATHRVYVGFASGALTAIDPVTKQRIATVELKAHPEGFQLDPEGSRIFVNLPKSTEIAVVDRASGKQVASWSTDGGLANFPMALDPVRRRVLSVFRFPARLKVFGYDDGKIIANVHTCGDADDVFLDAQRQRIYVICGEGFVDAFDARTDTYPHVGKLATVPGARTGLFIQSLDRLFVAVRATDHEPAAVWVLRPTP